ncbi:hypothetical protein BME24068_06405 [Burkholderia metallica]|nr:hypothetical protein BME24068_06405 [Burkholderia metallica]
MPPGTGVRRPPHAQRARGGPGRQAVVVSMTPGIFTSGFTSAS